MIYVKQATLIYSTPSSITNGSLEKIPMKNGANRYTTAVAIIEKAAPKLTAIPRIFLMDLRSFKPQYCTAKTAHPDKNP